MTAAVYVVGGARDHEELRYSLRSLTYAPDITQVWIVGVVPDWITGVRRIELEPVPEKFANQRRSLTAFAQHRGAPTRFYLFNEDHYLTEPVEGELPTFHLSDALEYIGRVWREKNTWCHAVRNTAEWLNETTGRRSLAYEAHTPLLMDRLLVREALDAYPPERSLAMSMLYNVAGAGGVGADVGNAKMAGGDLKAKLSQAMPFISSNPKTFDESLRAWLHATFPEPSRFEN